MSKKEHIRRLWIDCFGESPEYADMYFSRIYSEENGLLATTPDDNRPVCSLQIYPYAMRLAGADASLSYLAGAATARKYRGRGYMSRLMLNALNIAAERGDVMCALIPAHDWLYFFFERFGFSSIYLADRQCYTSFHPFSTEQEYHQLTDHYAPEIYEAFAEMEQKRPGGIIHSQRDFLNILDDLSFRNGGTFVAVGRDDLKVAGMAWAFDRGDFIQVNELLGVDDDARTGALQALRRAFPDRQFTVLAPVDDSNGRRLHSRGMGRIVNADKMLSILANANPTWRSVIRVNDPLLEMNCHTFIVKDGECHIDDNFNGHTDLDVTIDVLTRIAFSSPKMGSVIGFPSARTHISLMPH